MAVGHTIPRYIRYYLLVGLLGLVVYNIGRSIRLVSFGLVLRETSSVQRVHCPDNNYLFRGMVLAGLWGNALCLTLFGLARRFGIHSQAYFVVWWAVDGLFQSTG